MSEKTFVSTYTNKVCLYINDFEINNGFMLSCIIKKDYYGSNAPIIMVTYDTDREVALKILKILESGKPLKGKIKIETYDQRGRPRVIYEGEDYDVIKGTTSLVSDDSNDTSQDPNVHAVGNKFAFGLVKKAHLKAFQKGIINNIFTDITPSAALAYAFNECCSSPKLKLAPMVIQSTESGELFCPPMGFFQFMEYIENEFGLYDTPFNTFIDDKDIMYILDRSNRDVDIGEKHDLLVNISGEINIYPGYVVENPVDFDELSISRENITLLPNHIPMNDIQIVPHPEKGVVNAPDPSDTRGFVVHPTTSKKRLTRKSIEIERVRLDLKFPTRIEPYTKVVVSDKRFANIVYRPEMFVQKITRDNILTNLFVFRSKYL